MLKKISFKNDIWKTPYIPTVPVLVEGVENSSVALADRNKDDWQLYFKEISEIPSAFAANQDYNFDLISNEAWQRVIVPGSLIMQGFNVLNNCEYYYKRKISLPPDFSGKQIFIRFEGVYSNARVWINNKFVQKHTGGFTIWDCDVSAFADKNELTLVVGVTDIEGDKKCPWNPDGIKMSDSGWASYYAHCNVGGILRDVTLFALPRDYIARNHINTEFSDNYKSADLRVSLEVHSSSLKIEIIADLTDQNDKCIQSESFILNEDFIDTNVFNDMGLVMKPSTKWKLKNKQRHKNDILYSKYYVNTFRDKPVDSEAYSAQISMNVKNPKLWDAEHPNLYKIKLTLKVNGITMQANTYTFGFREIIYGGKNGTDKNKVYVNGTEIKLRGVCRHDVSHLYGRSITDEDVYNEILTYKQNNINNIRTSHYPASDYLLSVCDLLGIYVEQENSACFKGANGFKIYNAPQNFVDTFAEMIESARNHPSVIIWSLANESHFEKTYAFRTEYEYVKKADDTRPVIFSYPHTVHSKPLPYDIFSRHYKQVSSNLGGKNTPVLHDEFAHVSCYNLERLLRDNSSREAWGESIKKGWENIFKTDGALGCAIWGGVDDVFYIPENTTESHQSHAKGDCAGYGEWGCIFDAYKREKPEAYLTKKAFSPVVLNTDKTRFGETMGIYLENRFDHTALDEIRMVCKSVDEKPLFDGYIPKNIKPHSFGEITFSNPDKSDVMVSFYHGEYLVDKYLLVNKSSEKFSNYSDDKILVHFNKNESLLNIKNSSGNIIAKGPFVSINGADAKTKNVKFGNDVWSAQVCCKNFAVFKIIAELKNDKLSFNITAENPIASTMNLKEIGVQFTLVSEIDSVSWNRNSVYSLYPKGHIGRCNGTAMLKRDNSEVTPDKYGEKPGWGWEQDMKNYYLFTKSFSSAPATNDFKTQRTNINYYTVNFKDKTMLNIKTHSDNINAFVDVFTSPENQLPKLKITKGKNFGDLLWGNYTGEKTRLNSKNEFSFDVSLIKI